MLVRALAVVYFLYTFNTPPGKSGKVVCVTAAAAAKQVVLMSKAPYWAAVSKFSTNSGTSVSDGEENGDGGGDEGWWG